MLTALRIENLAIIDSLEVRFDEGFNVLTGETGAGKSILVDALDLVLGGRARAESLRTGAEEASVEALFEGVCLGDRLAELGLPHGNGELLIRRVVHRSGRGRAWVNGALATVGLLEQVTRGLLDISGQHEHVSLLDPHVHLSLLDGYAGLAEDIGRYGDAYRALLAKRRERDGLATDEAERDRRTDYLAFQLEEIDRLAPEIGEDESLAAERRRLFAADRLRSAAEEAELALYSGEGSAVEKLGRAVTRLGDLIALDPSLGSAVAPLKAALVELEEGARTLSGYSRSVQGDPARLLDVDERLEALRRLCRKHGGSLQALFARRQEMQRELSAMTTNAERLAALASECDGLGREALALARALSGKRSAAARDFAEAVRSELAALSMGGTTFEVALKARPLSSAVEGEAVEGAHLAEQGIDCCEFLISPNPGEAPRSLSRVASGGELSRVMLAVKRAQARTDPVPTYVFDEVDSGIGGAVAEAVGRMLKEVSRERQVLCITHLPQIASWADRHLHVGKEVRAGRTVSRVSALADGARTREIARMLAGVRITEGALHNAGEMLGAAGRRLPARKAAEKSMGKTGMG
jgi:DNA repair protein RecN (Recombination protein N)